MFVIKEVYIWICINIVLEWYVFFFYFIFFVENFYKVVGKCCKCLVFCEIIFFKVDLFYVVFLSDIFLKELIKDNVGNVIDVEI